MSIRPLVKPRASWSSMAERADPVSAASERSVKSGASYAASSTSMWASTMARSARVAMPGFRRRAALPEAMEASAPSAVMAAATTSGQAAAEIRSSMPSPVRSGTIAREIAASAAAVQIPPRTWAPTSTWNAVRLTASASRAVCRRADGTRRAICPSDSASMVSLCWPQVYLNSGGAGGAAVLRCSVCCSDILRLLQLGCLGGRFDARSACRRSPAPRCAEGRQRGRGNWRQ